MSHLSRVIALNFQTFRSDVAGFHWYVTGHQSRHSRHSGSGQGDKSLIYPQAAVGTGCSSPCRALLLAHTDCQGHLWYTLSLPLRLQSILKYQATNKSLDEDVDRSGLA